MKVLVTGSTGLLGSDIVYTLTKNNIETVKACFSQRDDSFIAADITSEEGIKKLEGLDWDCLIHTSAAKDPDECENNQEETYKINVLSTENLAKIAYARNAKMLFISSDYVFSGNNPPYDETDTKDSINYYGKTKDIAEQKILSISDKFIILRVPILYGIRAGLKASAVLNSAINAINSGKSCKIDDAITRYPTYTGDVAETIYFLLNNSNGGIYHFSGQDKTTKFEIVKVISELLNKNIEHIEKLHNLPKTNAKRPQDSHLNMNKLISLGFELPIPFKDRVKTIIDN